MQATLDTDVTDRNTAIKMIRDALKERSGKAWSVTGGRGTAWGWISIDAPPARRNYDFNGEPTDSDYGVMGPDDRAELGELLGLDGPVHQQGHSVPAGSDYRREYVARARGEQPTVHGKPYWD